MNVCQQLDDYLDRDLSPDAAVAFERHLDECAECRAAVLASGELYATLREAGTPDVSWPALAARIGAGLRTQDATAVTRPAMDAGRRVVSQAFWMAAAVVLLAAAFLVLRMVTPADERANNAPRNPHATANSGHDSANGGGADLAGGSGTKPSTRLAAYRPSLVSQRGEKKYEQLAVKSENPAVTIVWLMEENTN